MTNLRKRLENVLGELAIIREGLDSSSRYPPCCLKVEKDGKIRCEVVGPLPEKEFLRECKRCRVWIRRTLARVDLEGDIHEKSVTSPP